jgi:hypothetical protein
MLSTTREWAVVKYLQTAEAVAREHASKKPKMYTSESSDSCTESATKIK